MKRIVKKLSLVALLAIIGLSVQAQKFGYVNSQGLLYEMAEVKEMQSNLEALQKQLKKQGETLVAAYQAEENDARVKKERGDLSPKDEEVVIQSLQTKQQELMDYEKKMQQQLVEKEQTLLQPIVDKVNAAINSVAEENGFQFIFDASTGVILYAEDSLDVSTLVKAKLGL